MPNEAEEILLPYKEINDKLLNTIDSLMREKKDISEILKITNEYILKRNYGFSDDEILMAENIRKKLLNRRLNRSKK